MKPTILSKTINRLSCGRLKFGWWSSAFQSAAAPVIIGGCGRSGTTLMRAMLNAHPNLHIGPETGILCGSLNMDNLAGATGLAVADVRMHHHRASCLGDFVERVMAQAQAQAGKPRWGEKSPSNVVNLARIFQFFPQARFIHMIRDGRDVACSLRTHPKYQWVDGRRLETGIINPWEKCIVRWVSDTNAGLSWRYDPRYIEVRYEDLVQEPERIIRQVLSFIDEPWDSSVLNYHETHDERGRDGANPGVNLPVYSSARSRWMQELPAQARALFTPQARQLLIHLGYAVDDSWVGDALADDASTSSTNQLCLQS